MTDVSTARQVTPDQRLLLDVLLRDGSMAQVRLVDAMDEAALCALNERVSLRTRMLRYFSVSDRPGWLYVEHVLRSARNGDALVALVGGQIVAVASFSRLERDPCLADLALLVDDAHQGAGLGALLLEHLAHLARQQGISALVAEVPLENTAMLGLLAESGFATSSEASHGVTELRVYLADRPQLWDAVHHREAESQRASLRPVLAPRSVAVVGSSRTGSVAEQVYRALTSGGPAGVGFTGTVHRVASGSSLADLTGAVDLVVVAVAADRVLDVARGAAAVGAKGLLVVSAGFAESGPAGQQQQQALLELCRSAGMRLVGPNCLGIVNTDPAVRLNATFCDAEPLPGSVALVSQSGAVGIAALRHAERRGAGLSMFVSTGNKADVSGNDLLAYLEDDPRTRVIALYLESFGNARKFARVAATVGRTKPIVVVKAGRSAAGARAGRSHTAAAATPEAAIGALLHEAGVVRVDDLPELFDVLALLQAGPLPSGPRLAVIGNSGGPGVLAADACTGTGLHLAELAPSTREQLRALLPLGAAVDNPIDLLATVGPREYEQAVALVLRDPGVDAVLAIYTPLTRGAEELYAAALSRAHAGAPTLPVIAAFPGVAWAPTELHGDAGGGPIPFFEFPEPAVRALGKVVRYSSWRSSPRPPPPSPPSAAACTAARALIGYPGDEVSAVAEPRWLAPHVATAVLEAYGIATARVVEAVDAAAAVTAAAAVGYPVALKAAGPTIVHKSDIGGVVLDLCDAAQVEAAFAALQGRVGPAMTSAVVQHMSPIGDGLELIAGITVDPSVGPLVVVGAGGTLTDVLGDRTVRMPPASKAAALEQLNSLRCASRLGGYRGSPALAIDAAADVLLRLADITRDLPEVRELDLNPLLVSPAGVCALDVRIRVGSAVCSPDDATRTLTRQHT